MSTTNLSGMVALGSGESTIDDEDSIIVDHDEANVDTNAATVRDNEKSNADDHESITDDEEWTKGDFTLISSDNVRFQVPSYYLLAARREMCLRRSADTAVPSFVTLAK